MSLLKELEETLPSLYPYFLERQESEQKHFDATRKMINHQSFFPSAEECEIVDNGVVRIEPAQ